MRDGKNEWSMASENSPWFDRRTVFKILIAGRQRDTSRRARAVLEVPSAESSGLNYGGVWCGGVWCGRGVGVGRASWWMAVRSVHGVRT